MAILSSGRVELFLRSSVPDQNMLAQWKSDGLIARKCQIAILSFCRIELFLGYSVSYQSMLAQWKSDCLDRNEDMFFVT
jgi:hypothetical protein